MTWLKRAVVSFFVVTWTALLVTAAFPQGAVTLVQIILGGLPISGSNPLPVTGSFSASLGGFTPSASGARMTPLSVGLTDSSGNLPTGTVVVVSNVGTSNPMYCNVNGIAATTSDELIPINSWFAFTIPAAVTTLHCIATGGTTTANGVGGSGLPTGAGGGSSGGGGGGTVAQGNAGSNAQAWWTQIGDTARGPAKVQAGNAAAAADVSLTVADPNVLAAVNAPIPSQSPAVPIGGVGLCDGANGATNPCTTAATVKAASTPAASTDKALVVDQRPGTTVATSGAVNVTPTDCSGTIGTGGTAQNAITAQTTLHGLTIMNLDTTEPMWISFTTTAAASTVASYPLQAATATTFASPGNFTSPPGFGTNHALSVIAATTGHKFSCTWW